MFNKIVFDKVDNLNINRIHSFKLGFTLAEVLITLGIIGVVSAITIPSLISKYEKQATVTKLKRAIAVINQAYRLSFAENGEPDSEYIINMQITPEEYFNTYWAPYIKTLTYCNEPHQCGYNKYNPYIALNGKEAGTWYAIEGRLRATFITFDGFIYVIAYRTWKNSDTVGLETKETADILVDINGGKRPNQYGRDVFLLERDVSQMGDSIKPYCSGKSDSEINLNCSASGKGDCCAEKIRRDGWAIIQSYPWK